MNQAASANHLVLNVQTCGMYVLFCKYFLYLMIGVTFSKKIVYGGYRSRFYIFVEMDVALHMNNVCNIRSKSKMKYIFVFTPLSKSPPQPNLSGC